MFDIAPTELLVLGAVAIMVIPPKDLPKAMRLAGHWVGKARGVARQFRSGFDSMVRDAELAEMEKKWKEENERIVREHPVAALTDHLTGRDEGHAASEPVTVEKPVVLPAPDHAAAIEPSSGVGRSAS